MAPFLRSPPPFRKKGGGKGGEIQKRATTQGQLKYEREALVGHGNGYISIHPYFFKTAFLDPQTHHFLREIMEADNFNQVC